ncbi:polysaccharide pyruvyl transferase family protein [Pseudomonas lopnurensis]|uniref:polysaccharide pyruvyl transferase family protein n=1 Tax=Pseudomonas lopnurensis TaxID=1477517 RepID=UPI001879F7E7|nr:polysaccharide pyruvyl transferase family protein [Pseudomonas lopnurensis]MBE7373021.1 polysaccharide pyruvyl transferase family protein [Pseudomonas lopnurensis]
MDIEAGGFRVLFVNDTRAEAHVGCELVVRNLTALILELGGVVSGYISIRNISSAVPFLKEHSDELDLVLINGEGSMHRDKEIAYELVRVAGVSCQLDIPCVLVNATVRCNSYDLYGSFNFFRFIAVREEASFDELAGFNISSEVIPDALFFSEFSSIEHASHHENKVRLAVTDSVVPSTALQLEELRVSLCGEAETLFFASSRVSWIKEFFRRYPKRWALKNPLHGIRFFLLLFVWLPSVKRNVDAFVEGLKCYDFVITGRFHLVCLLMMLEIPFYAVESNTDKISSLLKGVGLNRRCFRDVASMRSAIHRHGLLPFSNEERMLINKYKDLISIKRGGLKEVLAGLVPRCKQGRRL